jgi:TolA-binding protein
MISMSRVVVGPLLALSVAGCFATKGDMRLLQEEIRTARASAARSDSVQQRTSDSLRTALANLARVQTLAARDGQTAQQKTADEVKALSAKVQSNDIATKEAIKSLNDDVDQLRDITRQNARGQAAARAQIEAARAAAPTTPDTTAGVTSTPPAGGGAPGSATMLLSGRTLIIQGSCGTARRTFQDLITQYPDSPDAPEALYSIAASYVDCGDGASPAKADSVYRLVVERYPRSEFAATSLYKRAEALREASKPAEAKALYEKILCEHPKSLVSTQALNRLGGVRPRNCRPSGVNPI